MEGLISKHPVISDPDSKYTLLVPKVRARVANPRGCCEACC